jgi:hypothetical protein
VVDCGDVPTWCLVGLGAIGGAAALWQLRLQRIQLAAQQKVIADDALVREREQANQIDVTARQVDGG